MSVGDGPAWLGLDIGGANLKAAHSTGQARSMPFEVWKRPEELPDQLARLGSLLPAADRIAVTMTAELCDCYPSKAKGVQEILNAVSGAFPGLLISVWGTDEEFHDIEEAKARPELPAASNWLALAHVAGRLIPEGPGLLIDIGTTTTDLIPLLDGRVAARGRTDLQRLRNGELVYAGVRRTPVMAVAPELEFRGERTGLAAELFASTLDVYLVLGEIAPDPTDDSTADGRPATVEASADRLARMVLCDVSEFGPSDARALAEAADAALMERLSSAAARACGSTIGVPRAVIVSGAGSFLARRLGVRVAVAGAPVVDLDEEWGALNSVAGCAHALVTLARERLSGTSA